MLDNISELFSSAGLLKVTSPTPSLTFDNICSKDASLDTDKNNTFYQDSIRDASRRYKLLNGKNYQFPKQASLFFDILYNVIPVAEPILYFDDDSLTADFMFNNIEYTLKNDFDFPESVFLSHFNIVNNKKRLNIAEYAVSDLASIRDAINV